MKYMDGASVAQQRSFTVVSSALEPLREQRLPLVIRLGNWLGVTMAHTENPRGFSVNPAVITLVLVILGMVAGGAYYMGQRDNESQNLLKRLEAAEKKAETADTKATYAVSSRDKEEGHGPNTNQKTK